MRRAERLRGLLGRALDVPRVPLQVPGNVSVQECYLQPTMFHCHKNLWWLVWLVWLINRLIDKFEIDLLHLSNGRVNDSLNLVSYDVPNDLQNNLNTWQKMSWNSPFPGEKNCEDGSDEEDCNKYTCMESQFKCEDRCIQQSSRCNGIPDCKNAEDEKDCRELRQPTSMPHHIYHHHHHHHIYHHHQIVLNCLTIPRNLQVYLISMNK